MTQPLPPTDPFLPGMGKDVNVQKLLESNPELAQFFGAEQAGPALPPYASALASFDFITTQPELAANPELLAHQRSQGITAAGLGYEYGPGWTRDKATGAILFHDGTILTAEGQVITNPDGDGPLTTTWRRKVLSWDKGQAQKWRKTLAKLGYNVAEKGGMDQGLLAALEQYHKDRYTNLGEVVPVDASGAEQVSIDDIYSAPALRADIKGMVEGFIGDEATDEQVTYFEQRFRTLGKKHLRKGEEPAEAAALAAEGIANEFESHPQVEFAKESDEENTALLDAITMHAQMSDFLARG